MRLAIGVAIRRPCSVVGCDGTHKAQGLCSKHYQHDFGPAFRRLAAIHNWDELDAEPPIAPPRAPRPMPPARQDAATVRRRAEWLRALARATRGRA